jgi:hypothetical protein
MLSIPAVAHASGSGGMLSPDPSTQIAPDPAPSGGEVGFHGTGGKAPPEPISNPTSPRVTPSNPPVGSTGPAQGARTSTAQRATTAKHRTRPRHTAATHRRAHQASRSHHVRVEAARRVPALFASTLALALHVAGPAHLPSDASGESGDALLLGAIALLLFVFGGLMMVRATTQVMRRERPA